MIDPCPRQLGILPGMGRGGAGFTLVEVLVTTAVILVLGVLLFAQSGKLFRTASRSECAANLRTIGSGFHLYASEHGGMLPPASHPVLGKFSALLAPYTVSMLSDVQAAEVFYCPENVRLDSPPAEGYTRGSVSGYKGWGGYFFGYLINTSFFPVNGTGAPDNPNRVALARASKPAQTVALMDMMTRGPSVTAPPTSSLAGARYFDPANPAFSLGRIHNESGNILFLDGHVQSYSGESNLRVISVRDQTEPWQ